MIPVAPFLLNAGRLLPLLICLFFNPSGIHLPIHASREINCLFTVLAIQWTSCSKELYPETLIVVN